jgi:hypothetical protein
MSKTTPQPGPDPDSSATRWKARLDRQRVALAMTAMVTLGCLAVLILLLSVDHTVGGEVDGPEVAIFGIVVGILSLILLAAPGRHRFMLGALLVLWTLLAIGGIDGYEQHSKAVTAATVDQRPRPPLAPLVFTAFGIVGASALIVSSRRIRRPPSTDRAP